MLAPGNVSDRKAAPAYLERTGRLRYPLGDKGYVADRLRSVARDAGATVVISGRRNRERANRYTDRRYAGRHLPENVFCRLKDFRCIHTLNDKLATISPVGCSARDRRRLLAVNENER